MKKRRLRPEIREILFFFTLALGIFIVSIDYFSLSALPALLVLIGILFLHVKILDTF